MSTSALAPATLDEIATLFVGFELSKATWLIGLYRPRFTLPLGHGVHPRKGPVIATSPAYHDHSPQRLLQNFRDTTCGKRPGHRISHGQGCFWALLERRVDMTSHALIS